jgi:hypothetical protein
VAAPRLRERGFLVRRRSNLLPTVIALKRMRRACREQAARCRLKAKQSHASCEREHYFELALMWERAAADLEYTQSLVDVMDNIAASFEKPSKPAPKAA